MWDDFSGNRLRLEEGGDWAGSDQRWGYANVLITNDELARSMLDTVEADPCFPSPVGVTRKKRPARSRISGPVQALG